ncbi:MAG: hypothetical protein HFH48_06370 [Lachnospiraceae bacterium]|nr:hypothetical protein [Lachnospiraceae bacterium]
MNLYDGMIAETRELTKKWQVQSFPYEEKKCWREARREEMILQRDAAYELGGGSLPSVNYTCVTSDSALVPKNQIFLYGPELGEIREDTAFGRIVFLETEEVTGEEAAYRFIRELEYVKYHIFPKGYMVRASGKGCREQARVSREALKRGISFWGLGCTYIRKYLEQPGVKHVQILFLAGKESLGEFQRIAEQADAVTNALSHILKGMPMNCGSCDLKSICDEVEGMRKLHQSAGILQDE